ncbi:MAG: SDR family oxidoreductase [Gammaproteobacteria bacterium]|jgi:short-subunit dehydrogenase|nr:SDR family oxidoreductase [Gammaproteobacteria bacterium]
MNLVGSRVLITGATGGIGSALADKLRGQGCELLLHGHSTRQTCNEKFVRADLRTSDGLTRLVDAATNFNINVLINNCGVNDFGAFEEVDIDRILNVNVVAPMLLSQALLPHLRAQKAAVIYNVGSTFGQIGYPGYVAYCASKHAIKGFNDALARELADSSIRVQYLSPRAVGTDMNGDAANALNVELGNAVDTPFQVAEIIARQITHGDSRVQIGFVESLQVSLNGLFPGIIDSALAKQLCQIKRYF